MGSIIKFIVFTAVLLGIGYGGFTFYQSKMSGQSQEGQGAQAQGGQPMPVQVQIVKKEPIQIWKEFSARLEAVDFAEIRPQVSGVIQKVNFEDGAQVKKGDILYVIDTRPYQAAVNRIQADLNVALNETELAQKELDRAQNLIEVDAISKRIFDERESKLDVAKSRVSSMRAQLEQAQINLDYANVKAPISGKVSRDEIKLGNLVQAGPNAPLLTSIVSDAGIFADFEIDETTYLSEVRHMRENGDDAAIPVQLILSNGDIAATGVVQSFDNQIDSRSGTIRARALFDNKDNILLPGMFSTIKMGSAQPHEVIVITDQAIGTDQNRRFVMVVENNTVTIRPITLGDSMDGKTIVTSCLNEGDKVITEGIMRVRPGMPVDPKTSEEMASMAQATETPQQ